MTAMKGSKKALAFEMMLEALKDTRGGLLVLVEMLERDGYPSTSASLVELIRVNDIAIAAGDNPNILES